MLLDPEADNSGPGTTINDHLVLYQFSLIDSFPIRHKIQCQLITTRLSLADQGSLILTNGLLLAYTQSSTSGNDLETVELRIRRAIKGRNTSYHTISMDGGSLSLFEDHHDQGCASSW